MKIKLVEKKFIGKCFYSTGWTKREQCLKHISIKKLILNFFPDHASKLVTETGLLKGPKERHRWCFDSLPWIREETLVVKGRKEP